MDNIYQGLPYTVDLSFVPIGTTFTCALYQKATKTRVFDSDTRAEDVDSATFSAATTASLKVGCYDLFVYDSSHMIKYVENYARVIETGITVN